MFTVQSVTWLIFSLLYVCVSERARESEREREREREQLCVILICV